MRSPVEILIGYQYAT